MLVIIIATGGAGLAGFCAGFLFACRKRPGEAR